MTFLDNSADSDGGAIDSADGATGTLTVTGSTFTSNSAGQRRRGHRQRRCRHGQH